MYRNNRGQNKKAVANVRRSCKTASYKYNESFNFSTIPQARINDDSFVAISDTHIGSTLEKKYYLDCVYEYVTKYGINDIVHCGDILQSTILPYKPEYNSVHKQIDHLLNIYPQDTTVTNHMLLGNHDFHALRGNPELLKVLQSRKDFNIMGFKRAYIEWGELLFSVFHDIKKYHNNLPDIKVDFYLSGHRHNLRVKENSVNVPSLSMDVKHYGESQSYPGFLNIQKEDDAIIFSWFTFKEKISKDMSSYEAKLLSEKEVKPTDSGTVLKLHPKHY